MNEILPFWTPHPKNALEIIIIIGGWFPFSIYLSVCIHDSNWPPYIHSAWQVHAFFYQANFCLIRSCAAQYFREKYITLGPLLRGVMYFQFLVTTSTQENIDIERFISVWSKEQLQCFLYLLYMRRQTALQLMRDISLRSHPLCPLHTENLFHCLDTCIKCTSNVDTLFWDSIFN